MQEPYKEIQITFKTKANNKTDVIVNMLYILTESMDINNAEVKVDGVAKFFNY